MRVLPEQSFAYHEMLYCYENAEIDHAPVSGKQIRRDLTAPGVADLVQLEQRGRPLKQLSGDGVRQLHANAAQV